MRTPTSVVSSSWMRMPRRSASGWPVVQFVSNCCTSVSSVRPDETRSSHWRHVRSLRLLLRRLHRLDARKRALTLYVEWRNQHAIWTFEQCAVTTFVMVALCNRADHYIFILFLSFFLLLLLLLLSFFSSPNLSSRRLDVYHTSAHGVVLV